MKVFFLVPAVALFAITSSAQTLSQGERDRAMSYLHATRKQFLDIVQSVSDSQFRFKPGPDRWSIAEVAEHLTLAEDLMYGAAQRTLESPKVTVAPEEFKKKDEAILKMVPDRSRKAQAPEQIRPTGKFGTRDALVAEFKSRRDRTIEFVKTTKAELRSHTSPHPVFGAIDVYEWVLFIAAHSDRHIQQMREVMADAKYPR
ncbi:MAG: DinB family protein [Bryobacterales bacterium]|nr:DinB family protein [Bryobacterales bacterium]